MADITIARRYAGALYQEAERENRVEEVDADVELIRSTMVASRELVLLFESPVVPREKKERVVRELFGPRVTPATLHFLELLIEKQRENLFPLIVESYRALRDEQLGIVEAHARVAQPLGAAETEQLVAALERMTNRRVRLDVQQEPSLIGGLVVRVGDTVYDGSVRHQLQSLRGQLEHGVALRTNGRQ